MALIDNCDDNTFQSVGERPMNQPIILLLILDRHSWQLFDIWSVIKSSDVAKKDTIGSTIEMSILSEHQNWNHKLNHKTVD